MEDDGNPLAEIGLALSMAFFSLMVLLLFAVTQSPQSHSALEIQHKENRHKIETSAQTQRRAEAPPSFLIYDHGKIYDTQFKPVILTELPQSQKFVVGVNPELNTKSLLDLMESLAAFDVEITTLNQDWQTALLRVREKNQ